MISTLPFLHAAALVASPYDIKPSIAIASETPVLKLLPEEVTANGPEATVALIYPKLAGGTDLSAIVVVQALQNTIVTHAATVATVSFTRFILCLLTHPSQ